MSSSVAACSHVDRCARERLREGIQPTDHRDRITSQAPDRWPVIAGAAAGRDRRETIAWDPSAVLLRSCQSDAHPLQQTAAGQAV